MLNLSVICGRGSGVAGEGYVHVCLCLAVETGGAYSPLLEEDLQSTCIHWRDFWFTLRTREVLLPAPRVHSTTAVHWWWDGPSQGRVPGQDEAGQAVCGGSWGWSRRCLQGRWVTG